MAGQHLSQPAAAGGTSLIAQARAAMTHMDRFTAQPALRRAFPAIGMLLAVGLAVAAWLVLAPAERVALQNGLPPAEKARALEALTASGMDAQIDPSSGILTVPADQFHRARMVLATEGLPQGAADGMSAISDLPMGTSRQIESAHLRRMQELDIARSITELQPVRSARVHLALPERSAFVRDQQPPRASVFLELAPGMGLSQSQVSAIVSLVATAIPDMPRGNISVVDQSGTLLTTDQDDPLHAQADSQMKYRQQLERIYRERILSLVTPMVGAGNAAVEITLDMDFTRSEITSEEYLPDTALRSEQSSRQVNTNPVAAGIPGAVSNTPPADPEMADTKQSGKAAQQESSSSSSLTRNYEVSRRVETRHPQTGQITRVHAAVLLHRPEATSDTPPPALPLTDIEALTKSAIGFDPTRGDVVTVTSAAFVQNGPVVTAPRWYEAAWLPSLGRSLAQLIVLGIVVLGVVRPLLHRLLPPARSGGVPDMNLSEAIEVRKGETLADLRDRVGSLDDLNSAITYDEKIEVLRQMALSDTNRVTSVFKSMLSTPKDADQ